MNFNRLLRPLLLAAIILAVASASFAAVFISVTVAPPPLPVYVQPPCPAPGYIWIPGYWAWDEGGYYWVPGTWVPAPEPGLLWTPGYWGWDDGVYIWNAGYWGPHVGFYGGVNYGFGYFGVGFVGGEWRGDRFYYNRAVVNVDNRRITNVYVNKTVIVNNYYTRDRHVSFHGPGGIQRQPMQQELIASRDNHIPRTAIQTRHIDAARRNPQLLARNNAGRPPVAATVRPADFGRRATVPARAAGGRISPQVLRATPKNMPPPPAGRGFANRATPAAPGGATRGTPGAVNRPAPGNRGANNVGTLNRNAPRPPSAAPNRGFENRGNANERRTPEPGSRPNFGTNNRPAAPPERMPSARPVTPGRVPSTPERPQRGVNPPQRDFNPPRNQPQRFESRPMPERPARNEPRVEPRPTPQARPDFAERGPAMRSERRPEMRPPQPRPEMRSPQPRPETRSGPPPRPERGGERNDRRH